MTGIVDICNMALEELRAPPIVNLTDSNTRAEACNRFYDRDRQFVLRGHTWNFAIKRSELLGTLEDAPTFEFNNYHQLPSDLLRIITVYDANGTILPSSYYAVEGKKLASDESNLYVRYIWDITDVNTFDVMFQRCLALKLASSIAMQITGNATAKSEMYNLYLDILAETKSVDGQERPPIIVKRSPLVDSRIQYRYKTGGC